MTASAFASLAYDLRWVAWRNETRGKEGKLTKVPYGRAGLHAKANDETTWVTRAEAERLARRIVDGRGGGIGYELGDIGNDLFIAGLDLDSCLADGNLAGWAATILAVIDTYAEVSPSGTGIKAFFYVMSDDVRPFLHRIRVDATAYGCRRAIPGADSRDHGPAIEFYAAERYFAVTDDRWPDAPNAIRLLDGEALDLLVTLIPPAAAGVAKGTGGDTSRSATAFRKGQAAKRAGKTYDEWVAEMLVDPDSAAWTREKGEPSNQRELRRIWDRAVGVAVEGVVIDDFRAYMPMHNYVFMPSRDLWPAISVNARVPPVVIGYDENGEPVTIPASVWLDQNRPVEQMTWAPGLPEVIKDRLIIEGGWIERKDVSCFNLYMPPTLAHGDPNKARPWLDHVRLIYPDDAEHILSWLAHRVQRPQAKINHALILSGAPGIGKDTLLEPVKRAIGPWNFREASPSQVLGRFNGFLKGVILRISEVKDLGETDRYAFYEHMKAITAAPPDVLRCDEKHIREHAVLNVCGVVYTTNYKAEGLYLPADDRRHYVAWSRLTKEDFSGEYWAGLWSFFDSGGDSHVAAHLAQRDLSAFNPKAPPPKTDAFWDIVNAHRPSETAELADVLDNMGNPDAVTLREVITDVGGNEDFSNWLKDRKNRTKIPHRFEECSYTPVRNPDADDGLWRIRGRREVVYSKSAYSKQMQIAAAEKLRAPRQWRQ